MNYVLSEHIEKYHICAIILEKSILEKVSALEITVGNISFIEILKVVLIIEILNDYKVILILEIKSIGFRN